MPDERPAAPAPPAPGAPPTRREGPDLDDDTADGPLPDDEDELGDDAGDDVFGRPWPDDEEEPPPSVVDEPEPSDDDFSAAADDDEEAWAVAGDAPSIDELEDLAAADDTDIPVIEADLLVRVDGATIPARVDWARTTSVWVRPAGSAPDRVVAIEIAGRRLQTTLSVVAGDQECVLLGRDLLKGRFLLRV